MATRFEQELTETTEIKSGVISNLCYLRFLLFYSESQSMSPNPVRDGEAT